MNAVITKNEAQNVVKKPKKFIWISLIIFILIMLSIAAQFSYALLGHDQIYTGITVNGLAAGGLTKDELASLLNKNYLERLNDLEIILKAETAEEKFSFSDISVSYDIETAIEEAYAKGRSGNMFKRLKDLLYLRKNGLDISLNNTFDKQKLDSIVQKLYNKTYIPVKEASIISEGNEVKFLSGQKGQSIDIDSISTEVEALVKVFSEGTIEISTIITEPQKLDLDNLYNQIYREPKNAYAKVENNKAIIVPHVMGIEVDKQYLESLIPELEMLVNSQKTISVSLVTPEITTEKAEQLLFKDVLATRSTHFSSSTASEQNRGQNIKLAVNKINGKILAPGEVFSFNDIVGRRSEANGFKVAHVYQNGKVIEGVGGGICQVSSTLYNSVLLSDLEVVERRNHSLIVGYLPIGTDASVSYGYVDFKFKNSTQWPIKINAKVTENNQIIFTLIGTNMTPGKSIEIATETIKTVPYTTKYIDDPSLPEGTTRVIQSGKNGYTVDTYKIVKQDGKIISKKKIHTSVYKMLEREMVRGTKKVAPVNPPVTENPQEQNETDPPAQNVNGDVNEVETEDISDIIDVENIEEIVE